MSVPPGRKVSAGNENLAAEVCFSEQICALGIGLHLLRRPGHAGYC
jgi:hypothetical protein